ncbi:MAG: FG-GAP repeat protein [Flavobacteriales bacterium]|jgi:sugar lactone lactonase YvrE|nr:FG-GAP repeat protein [Flavobacteriales bacterium]
MKNKSMLGIAFILLILTVTSFSSFAQIGIGTTIPDQSATLELSSSTQGFLMPRLTYSQIDDIINPAEGLMVYSIDENCLCTYNSNIWVNLCTNIEVYNLPTKQKKIITPNGIGSSYFGTTVSLSDDGKNGVVGAYLDDSSMGAVYVYSINDSVWTEDQKIVPTNNIGVSNFGYATKMSPDGTKIAVGAFSDDNSIGAVYIYSLNGSNVWVEDQKIVPTNGIGTGQFGGSVDFNADGSKIIASSLSDNGSIGAVYVYSLDGSNVWVQDQKIIPTNGIGNGLFGLAMALNADGTRFIVSAYLDNSDIGAVYVFSLNGSNVWVQDQKIIPTNNVGAGKFGRSIALNSDGTTLSVGSYTDNNSIGAVYIYSLNGSNVWVQNQKIIPTNAIGASEFGTSLDFSNDGSRMIIGAPIDNSKIGAAYLYSLNSNNNWVEHKKITPDNHIGINDFGFSVSFHSVGTQAIVGAPRDNSDLGAVYLIY